MEIPEKCASKPNLWRVTCELMKFKDPYKAADTLMALAGPVLKEGQQEQNNEHFKRLLNGCRDPRAVYAALLELKAELRRWEKPRRKE